MVNYKENMPLSLRRIPPAELTLIKRLKEIPRFFCVSLKIFTFYIASQ